MHQADKMLQTPEAMEMVGVKSVNTLKKLIREKGFPKPYELLEGRKSFSMREIEVWLQERMVEQRRRQPMK